MANVQIPNLPVAIALSGSEQLEAVQAGTSVRVTALQIADLLSSRYITSITGVSPIVASGGTTPTISIIQATTLTDGYLSSSDWNTFNDKVTSVSATSPIASSGGTTPTISIGQATTSTDGYLSSTDWNTFNNKTSNTGTVTSVTGGAYLTGGTITTSGTLAVDATSANTASKVVARDASGDFSAGTITASLSGNATTATTATTADAWTTARTLSFTGDATGSGSVDGSADVATALTLANTAVSAGSYTNASITVDAKGRLTAASSGTAPVTDVTGTAPIASSGGVTPAISISQATTSTDGYLSSTDWNTFNNKTSNTGTVTSITAGSYLTGGTITTSGTITVDATSANTASKVVARDASGDFSAGTITASLSGNATTADAWSTARTLSFTGDATGSGSVDGSANVATALTLANTAVSAGSYTNASITVDAKGRLTAASSGTAPVTSVTGTAPIASSGGVTPAISISQATTSTDGYLSSTDWNTFNNKTSNTGTVTSVAGSGGSTGLTVSGGPITTSGTLTLGGTLAVTSGGTGLTSATTGDLLYSSATNTLSNLGIGTNGQALVVSGGLPSWQTISASAGGSDTQVQYNSSGSLAGSANFVYDYTNARVGIGTSSPSHKLETYVSDNNNLNIVSSVRNDQAAAGIAAIGFNVSSSGSGETSSVKAGIGLQRGYAYGGGALCFYNNNSGSAGNFTTADEKMRIDASGNVSIGTTSGGYKLRVNGTTYLENQTSIATGSGAYTTALTIEPSTDATSERAGINIGSWLLAQDSNGNGTKDFILYDANAAAGRIFVTTGGNVGIGVSSTSDKLEVGGSFRVTNGYGNIYGAGAGLAVESTNGWTQVIAKRGGQTAQAAFISQPYGSYSASNPYWAMGLTGDSTGNWGLETWDGTNLTRRATVDTSGNLIIGSNNAFSYKLRVDSGSLGSSVNNQSLMTTLYAYTGNSDQFDILYNRNSASTTNWTTADLILRRNVDGTAGQQQIRFNGDASTAFWTNSNERMRINSSGDVSIGTASSAGRLFVYGSGDEIARFDTSSGSPYISLYRQGTRMGYWYAPNGSYIEFTAENRPMYISATNSQYIHLETNNGTARQFHLYADGNCNLTNSHFTISNAYALAFRKTNGNWGAFFTNQGDNNFVMYTQDATNANIPNWSVTTNTSTPYAAYGAGTSNRITFDASTNVAQILTNGSPRFYITQSNVSFNTTQSSGDYNTFTFANDSRITVGGQYGYFTTNVYYNSGWKAYSTGGGIVQAFTAGDYRFYNAPSVAAGAASTITERFTILNNGNVGIGNYNPSEKLEVNGHIKINNGSSDGGNLILASAGNADWNIDNLNGYLRGYNNGVTKFMWDPNGNLNLYATTEGRALQIGEARTGDNYALIDLIGDTTYTDFGARFVRWGGANADSGIYHRGTGTLWMYAYDAGSFKVATNSAERFAIYSDGNSRFYTAAGADNSMIVEAGNAAYFNLKGTSYPEWSALRCLDGSSNEYWSIGGNGSAHTMVFKTTNGNERMRIDSSGNVGIGDSSPGNFYGNPTTLVVRRNQDNFTARLGLANTGGNSSNFQIQMITYTANSYVTSTLYNNNGSPFHEVVGGSALGSMRYICSYNGVYIGSGGTSWASLSDERKKDIIEDIDDGLSKVSSLRAVIGKYKTDPDGTRRAFLIAQDVQAVLPEAVSVDDVASKDEDYSVLGLSYTEVIPLLVSALKEASSKIETLEARVAQLEKV